MKKLIIILTSLLLIGCTDSKQSVGTPEIETEEAIVYINNYKELNRKHYMKATVVSASKDIGEDIRIDVEGFPKGVIPRQRFYIEFIDQWTKVVTDYGTERPAFEYVYSEVERHELKDLQYPIATTDKGEYSYSGMLKARDNIAPSFGIGSVFYATTEDGKITSI